MSASGFEFRPKIRPGATVHGTMNSLRTPVFRTHKAANTSAAPYKTLNTRSILFNLGVDRRKKALYQ